MTMWRHKKGGRVYEVITEFAAIQCSVPSVIEETFGEDYWTVYRDVKTNAHYVRPTEEFLDGRFEKVSEEP